VPPEIDIWGHQSDAQAYGHNAEAETEIKVSRFNFTRYGLLHGKVLSGSQDAVGKDDLKDQANNRVSRARRTQGRRPTTRA
jgi:hypothetical protein